MHWSRLWGRNAIDVLLPPTCIPCGASGDDGLDLCTRCRADLPLLGLACVRCAKPLPDAVLAASPYSAPLCGPCRRRSQPFERTHAAFRYEQPLPALVAGLKFSGKLNTLRLMGLLLSDHLEQDDAERPNGIVPVPLHPRRLRERGYNQALELARIVGRRLDLPLLPDGASRVRATPPQAALEAKQRKQNLRGAFAASANFSGTHLVVLDDVMTTGSTVGELARVLRRAGAARVDVWCLARTP